MESLHPCEIIASYFKEDIPTDGVEGICRITGKQSRGQLFDKWVKKTFADYSYLQQGDIISNEAEFSFAEKNEALTKYIGKDKLQKLRSYSIVLTDKLHFVTKADKQFIFEELLPQNPKIVCLAESGQKHILFKHKIGFWQVEEETGITPDLPLAQAIMKAAQELLTMEFSQTEIISGNYLGGRLLKCDVKRWRELELFLASHRGSKIYDFTMFLLYNPK